MTTRRRWQFIHGQVAWMVGVTLFLSVFDLLSVELFFVTSLVGFLALVEITAPFNVTPRWRSRLKWFVLLGLLGVGYVVVTTTLERIPPGFL